VSKRYPLTKPETAIVTGLAVILFTLLITARMSLINHQQERMAKEDLAAIQRASELFLTEHGYWPCDDNGILHDQRYGREYPNRRVFNVLQALRGEGNTKNLTNPNQIIFLEIAPRSRGTSGLNKEGDFVDPWGTPYQIVLDTDLNKHCDIEHSIYGRLEDTGIAVWSCGPDQTSDTADDLLGWEHTKK